MRVVYLSLFFPLLLPLPGRDEHQLTSPTGPASYLAEIKIRDAMTGIVIAKALASNSTTVAVGQHVSTWVAEWVELAILDAKDVTPIQPPKEVG